MALRRGFKAEAEERAHEIRDDLGLPDHAPLPVLDLAGHLGIPVVPLSNFRRDAPAAASLFLGKELETFSALTIFRGTRRLVVHNDAHTDGRQSSNLAHELAHGLLLHPPAPAIDDLGCRFWDQTIEEANWLAGALLVPKPAAIHIAKRERHTALETLAEEYAVSTQMLVWRLNVTGARKIVQRTAQTPLTMGPASL